MADIFKNSTEAIRAMRESKDKIEQALLKQMNKALLLIERDAKIECPVDLGQLRASIDHTAEIQEDKIKGRVGTNLDYSPYVHEGTGIYAVNGDGRKTPWKYKVDKGKYEGWHFTRGQKPQPFMRKSMDKNRDKIAVIFKDALEGIK